LSKPLAAPGIRALTAVTPVAVVGITCVLCWRRGAGFQGASRCGRFGWKAERPVGLALARLASFQMAPSLFPHIVKESLHLSIFQNGFLSFDKMQGIHFNSIICRPHPLTPSIPNHIPPNIHTLPYAFVPPFFRSISTKASL